ncbi:hypothetical protein JD844_025780 [Phrynosoma platyrhinos]|uniref:peptide-methionine (S)-S-oxide reductase n=1 Tax=Phrynosoma platyrhinos TaxID=52577 RepID=A0ABQ7T079_PHRPL|nr:hypothetical protein JD844_025780 [Phrynosoma platyrhinos]
MHLRKEAGEMVGPGEWGEEECEECTMPFQENLAFAAPLLPASHGTAVAWQEMKRQMSVSSGRLGSSCWFQMNSGAKQALGSLCPERKGNEQSPSDQRLPLHWACVACMQAAGLARQKKRGKERTDRPECRTKELLTEKGFGPITTEIREAPEFYYAEEYHQQYLSKNPNGYCGLGGTGVSCPLGD